MMSAATGTLTPCAGNGARLTITAAADGGENREHSRGVRAVAVATGNRLVGLTHVAQRLEPGAAIGTIILV